jgi:hypothetical protein
MGMVEFTVNRTIEDRENEQYERSYEVDNIVEMEKKSALGRAFQVWMSLHRRFDRVPSAAAFRAALASDAALSCQLYRVRYSAAGTIFVTEPDGRDSLRRIGIEDELDLTARHLANRSFASFLFFGGSAVIPTYQRVSGMSRGVRREYARLALPVSDDNEPAIYFALRDLVSAEATPGAAEEITG